MGWISGKKGTRVKQGTESFKFLLDIHKAVCWEDLSDDIHENILKYVN